MGIEERMKIKYYLKELQVETYEKDVYPEGKVLDCALGKNNFGISDRVPEFVKHYDASRFWDSPDISYSDLKRELCLFWSEYAELNADLIKVANGSRFIQERFNKIFITEGTKILGYAPQYTGYIMVAAVAGGIYKPIALNRKRNFKFDIDTFIPAITSEYAIVFVDNPNNPTGQVIDISDIEEIVKEAKRKGCAVMVDEAYGDYIDEGYSAIGLVNRYDNLVVTRTFSKGYGMGKTKVGYGVMSSKLAEYYDKVSIGIPGSVSDLGAKLARELLLDQDFVLNCRKRVKAGKDKLLEGLNQKGYLIAETDQSCPIFTIGHKDPNVDLRQDLLSQGVLSVSGSHFRNLGKNYVRINLPERPSELLGRV